MDRIETLRQQALHYAHFSHEMHYLFFSRYDALPAIPDYDRYADAFEYALSHLTPCISEGELIVGKHGVPLSPQQQIQWDNVYADKVVQQADLSGVGQDSHMAIDYELLLRSGIRGILDKIDEQIPLHNPESRPFYDACKRCLKAVITHSENYANAALALAEQTADQTRKQELLEISRICRQVPANPAQSFYEAIQSVHFVTHCLSVNPLRAWTQQFQLGHPDRYLLPYFEKDLQRGALTEEFAQLLLDCLGIQINHRVHSGLSSGYMVGGRDENGNVVANRLTQMCMQVIADVRLVYPSVGLCYTEEMPESYLAFACNLLAKGHSHPAIFQDDVITKGLLSYGVTKKEAHNYIHSTCVEITPVAASNVWVASPYTNMPQQLLNCMDREYESFEQLWNQLLATVDARIEKSFLNNNRRRQIRNTNSMNPLLSCFVNDCLSRGMDIERGGARYNWIMPSFVGMANTIDSLYAIKQLVFEENRLTMADFRKILDANFVGYETLHAYIQNRIPKYGNDLDEIDQYYPMLTEHIVSECKKHTAIHSNGNLIPSVFCWVMHERYGRDTGATPDGRLAGFPLGDGSGPCQGRELQGPTASILSSTKWDHTPFIGGVAVNLRFSAASLGKNSEATMMALLKTYLKRGGFEVQVNVVDNETLKKAQKDPDSYRDLVVRIGGYSDYFVNLSPQMQQELLLRTVHHV